MMRLVSKAIFTKRKIVFVFLLAILLPVSIGGYLSFKTFLKGNETVRKILESNFLASGKLALNSFEEALLEYEKKALNPDNFLSLYQVQEIDLARDNYRFESEAMSGRLFLLNERFQVVFPQTEYGDESFIVWQEDLLNNPFADSYNQAEYYEFSQKDFSRAAELYRQSMLVAPSQKLRAIAMEGIGRSFFSSQRYSAAYSVYKQLSEDFPGFQNKAGSPYGIVAAFQMFAIDQRLKREERSFEILLSLYKNIRSGTWPLNLTKYDFFISEIEAPLNGLVSQGKYPEIQKAYLALRDQLTPYMQALQFTDALKRDTIPKIKEKIDLNRIAGEGPSGRVLINFEEEFHLVSFNALPEFYDGKVFYGGFFWDMRFLKDSLLPRVLERVSLETELGLGIIFEEKPNAFPESTAGMPKDTLALSFRAFPFPWKFSVTQPAFADQERAARRENIMYGILLAVIVALILLGAFLIVRDISRESEAMRLKSEFVHNISHEFKTPLSLIRLYTDTLQRKENLASEQKQEAYQIITKESERLTHMIDNILDFSRIEMGKKEFNFARGDLSNLVRDTLNSYRYHLLRKRVTIHTDIAAGLPQIRFDEEAMASVVINLLSNAMKFSPDQKEVILRLFRENDQAVLQVEDKGIGISPKELDRIFERFYRISDRVVSETHGSGLGLPLIKHIVEAHGGKIKVKSEPGKGSVFSVILPFCGLENGKE